MNPFTSTTLNYDLVQDRRRTFEDAAARRRLLRFSTNPRVARRELERPPEWPSAATSELAPVVPLSAAAETEPATARVA